MPRVPEAAGGPRFAVVARVPTVAEAELACAQLRAVGVAARLDNAQTVSVLPMHSFALGGVGVVVEAVDAARAREALGLAGPSEEFDGDAREGEQTEPGSALALKDGDDWMRRAALAAGIGSLLVPVVPTLYSIAVLLGHAGAPLSPRGRRHRAVAIGFNALAVVIMALALRACL